VFDGYWRDKVEPIIDPIGAGLHRLGVTANVLTVIGVVGATAAAVTIGSGRLRMGFVLVLIAALPDLLDGAVAKAAGPTSKRGAFFDSTADRVTDTIVTSSVAWYFISDDRGLLAMVPVAIMGLSWLISYQRAKAESLGFDAKGGLMERAERLILLAVGLAFPTILVPVIWTMLVLTAITAIQRFVKIWNQATVEMAA
jgi:CDP-diacylglycerol--glycerol-3-phosphate 3-phosphatidyltransferase